MIIVVGNYKELSVVKGWRNHADMYAYLREKGMNIAHDRFHPNDHDFNSGCSGFEDFEKQYGKEAATLLAPEMRVEVEAVSPERYGAVLLAEAGLYFAMLAEQAERKIDTTLTERRIREIREDLTLLSKNRNGAVVEIPGAIVHSVSQTTKLAQLLELRAGEGDYIVSDEKKSCSVRQLQRHGGVYLVFHSEPRPIPALRLAWTENEIVAVHLDALNAAGQEAVRKALKA